MHHYRYNIGREVQCPDTIADSKALYIVGCEERSGVPRGTKVRGTGDVYYVVAKPKDGWPQVGGRDWHDIGKRFAVSESELEEWGNK